MGLSFKFSFKVGKKAGNPIKKQDILREKNSKIWKNAHNPEYYYDVDFYEEYVEHPTVDLITDETEPGVSNVDPNALTSLVV